VVGDELLHREADSTALPREPAQERAVHRPARKYEPYDTEPVRLSPNVNRMFEQRMSEYLATGRSTLERSRGAEVGDGIDNRLVTLSTAADRRAGVPLVAVASTGGDVVEQGEDIVNIDRFREEVIGSRVAKLTRQADTGIGGDNGDGRRGGCRIVFEGQ
jgi:hypothetical protein